MTRLRNWSGSIQFEPARLFRPANEEELSAFLRRESGKSGGVRVIGSGHSFTPLIETHETLMSLDSLSGLMSLDPETGTAELWAGTKLWRMNELLHEVGRALENLGDINRQSIGGSLSTGTHGTGSRLGSLVTQTEELTLITAGGERLRCSRQENTELFHAAGVSMGALGILSRVKLRTSPAYRLKLIQRNELLSEVLANVLERADRHRHFEFFFFPYTDRVMTKEINPTDEPAEGTTLVRLMNDVLLENAAFKLLSVVSRHLPGSSPTIARICGAAISTAQKVDWSDRIFSTPRWVRFQEMEFALPRQHLSQALLEIDEMIRHRKFQVHFPIECRFVASDDFWLSPSYQRDSAYIAVHMYQGMPYREYFEACQEIFLKYEGRPHWGKMHFLSSEQLRDRYPRWNDFHRLRWDLDPQGILLNPELRRLFGGL